MAITTKGWADFMLCSLKSKKIEASSEYVAQVHVPVIFFFLFYFISHGDAFATGGVVFPLQCHKSLESVWWRDCVLFSGHCVSLLVSRCQGSSGRAGLSNSGYSCCNVHVSHIGKGWESGKVLITGSNEDNSSVLGTQAFSKWCLVLVYPDSTIS